MLSRTLPAFLTLLMFFSLNAAAQSDFTVFGDSESFEQAFGVHMGQDDLLRVLGFGNADEIGGVDLQLSTFDLSNNLLSTVTFGSAEDDFGKRSIQHSDGFRISGFSGTGDVRATLWKVSSDASSYEEWTYDRPGTVEVFNDHLEMPDGSWIAAGYLKNGAISDPLVVAFSSAGDTLWSRRFVTPEIDYWMGVERTDAGELLLVGDRFQDAIGGYDVFLTRLAADGSFIEEHELGGPGNNGSRHIAPTTDGKFIVTGEGAPALGEAFDIMLIEAEPTGVPNWTRFYGGEGGDAGFDLIQVDDNTITISGYETTGLMVEFCLLITDRAGNQDTLIRRGQDLVDIG